MYKDVVLIRGGGDIASGAIQKLFRSGFKILVLEIENPTSIRRKVCFSEAVYEKQVTIEEITAVHVNNIEEINRAWENNKIPIVVDPKAEYIEILKPNVVVDAILAKRNLGTNMNMASVTIALGPGFDAGKDVDVVIETNRGHNLGRLIFNGSAEEDTGTPGNIAGCTTERVLYSPCKGIISNQKKIGDIITSDDTIAYVDGIAVKSSINGVLRGLIRDKSMVENKFKIGDVDPRVSEVKNCFTISDKARNIGGAVLEAVLYMKNLKCSS